jgi:PadR family transcriptional regulator PadR
MALPADIDDDIGRTSPAVAATRHAMRRTKKQDALQGTLDLLVLKTLRRSPHHGYGIAVHIQQVSGDILRVEEGSLYPALHRVEHAGWITAEWQVTPNNRRARVYQITRKGVKQLEAVEGKWVQLTQGVARVLKYS